MSNTDIFRETNHFLEKVYIYNELAKKYGDKIIIDIMDAYHEKTRKDWHDLAQRSLNNDIDTLVKFIWNIYCTKSAGFDYEIDKINKSTIQIHCRKCPAHDLVKRTGEFEWGYRIFCSVDPFMVKGFNPDIKFSMTKTLMQGDGYCNHRYSIE